MKDGFMGSDIYVLKRIMDQKGFTLAIPGNDATIAHKLRTVSEQVPRRFTVRASRL